MFEKNAMKFFSKKIHATLDLKNRRRREFSSRTRSELPERRRCAHGEMDFHTPDESNNWDTLSLRFIGCIEWREGAREEERVGRMRCKRGRGNNIALIDGRVVREGDGTRDSWSSRKIIRDIVLSLRSLQTDLLCLLDFQLCEKFYRENILMNKI